MDPNAGMVAMAPAAGSGLAPRNTASATLVAVGSFTARVPVKVVYGTKSLTPVHEWQPLQVPANRLRPAVNLSSAVSSSPGISEARTSFGAGRSELATGGTLRTYSPMAPRSDAVRFWKLRCTACAMGPNAEPRFNEWPVDRYCCNSSLVQLPIPESASLLRL